LQIIERYCKVVLGSFIANKLALLLLELLYMHLYCNEYTYSDKC